jgi:hypothetical protein
MALAAIAGHFARPFSSEVIVQPTDSQSFVEKPLCSLKNHYIVITNGFKRIGFYPLIRNSRIG